MKTSLLVSHLRSRVEDESNLNYTDTKLEGYLDQSALAVANLLKWEYLQRLFITTGSLNVVSGGYVSFKNAFGSVHPLRNAISKVYITNLSDGTADASFNLSLNKFADLVSYENGEADNLYYTNEAVNTVLAEKPASAYKPIAYIQDNKLYVKPFYSTETNITISYYREPFKHITDISTDLTFTSNRLSSASNINFRRGGYEVGQLIELTGTTNVANSSTYEITTVTDTFIEVEDNFPNAGADTASITISTVDNLGSNLTIPLLDYAEYLIWSEDNKPTRAKNAYSSALNQINTLNGR